MKHNILLLIAVINLITFASVFAQTVTPTRFIQVTGHITSLDSSKAVPYTTVQNKTNGLGVISQYDGFFSILMQETDTLVFSAVGYESQRYWFKRPPAAASVAINVRLMPRSYLLGEVNVYAYRGEAAFKRDFVELKLPDEKKVEMNLPAIELGRNFGYDAATLTPKMTFKGPISTLYDAFSKRGRELQKYAEVSEQYNRRKAYESRFNSEIVGRLTGLKDTELEAFMQYCRLPEHFVLTANEPELIMAINECLRNFKNNR